MKRRDLDISIQENTCRTSLAEQRSTAEYRLQPQDANHKLQTKTLRDLSLVDLEAKENRNDTTDMAYHSQNNSWGSQSSQESWNSEESWSSEDYQDRVAVSGITINGRTYMSYQSGDSIVADGEVYEIGPGYEGRFVETTNFYTTQRCSAPSYQCHWRTIYSNDDVTIHLGCGAVSHASCFWRYNAERSVRDDWNERCPSCNMPN